MSMLSTIKSLTLSEISRLREMVEGPPTPDLVKAVECARRDWQLALKEADYIDSDLDEYVIFKINSAERRYMALLEQARKEGTCAWPELTQFSCADEFSADSGHRENEPVCTG
ncbi:DUF2508 family protein [Pelotomaculum propionicicum]|uniref:DUF2508 family protein n=1 Tax=Pelotomaculum propionicicum TaxID=258475 RepID=UPI003B7E1ACB